MVEALAPRLNACSSIGMAPPASILQWVVADAVRPDIPSGFALFTPADGAVGSSVLQELADLWESIVSGVESVANFVIRQIKVSANNVVEWVHVAIQTAFFF